MAESHVSDVFKDYKKEIEEEDIHTGRDYANQVQPLLKRYTGTEHSKTEDKQMYKAIETLITTLEKKVTVVKDQISELQATEIKILKDNVDFDLDCELRPEHKRANSKLVLFDKTSPISSCVQPPPHS